MEVPPTARGLENSRWRLSSVLMTASFAKVRTLSSCSVSGSSAGVPYETIVLSYSKVEWKFKNEAEQHWDSVTNTGSMGK